MSFAYAKSLCLGQLNIKSSLACDRGREYSWNAAKDLIAELN